MFLTLKGSSNRLSEDVQKRFAEVEVDSSWKDWLFVAEEVQHQVRVSGMSGDIEQRELGSCFAGRRF